MAKNVLSSLLQKVSGETAVQATPELAPQELAPVTITHVVVISGEVAKKGTLAECTAFAKENCALSPVVRTRTAHTARVTTPRAEPTLELKQALEILVAAGYANHSGVVKHAIANPDSLLSRKQEAYVLSSAAQVKARRTTAKAQKAWDGTWKIVRGGVDVVTQLNYDSGKEVLRRYHEDPTTRDARLVRSNA